MFPELGEKVPKIIFPPPSFPLTAVGMPKRVVLLITGKVLHRMRVYSCWLLLW